MANSLLPLRYRKRPVVIEALVWDGDNYDDFRAFMGRGMSQQGAYLRIQTLEGVVSAGPGDYVIKGVQGEFYPCKPDIFTQTYEAVDD